MVVHNIFLAGVFGDLPLLDSGCTHTDLKKRQVLVVAFLIPGHTVEKKFKLSYEHLILSVGAYGILRAIEHQNTDKVVILSDSLSVIKLRNNLDDCAYISLQLHEFTEVVDTSQMAGFVRMLQGRDKELVEMISEKISQSPLEPYDSKYHLKIVSNLKDNFKNRLKDFNEIAIVAQFVVSLFMEIDIQLLLRSILAKKSPFRMS
ncbi:unnamed protein product [Acanthoscelides obtectus]|uniref:Uncharacterized protein n=1 Tax=Acanthoscelides obtectus TaxID=200917 RepID=A0A9P0P1J9_ACAOB|nr:unnamed protein product [Acanthoscelides obtectus]CAK1663943.1 hypothetical protein AOBTE_LOCUS23947 [Acanthoscelides obtectus]